MFKFIDGSKSNESYEDEIIIRCACGYEMLSFGFETISPPEDADLKIPSLIITYFNMPIKKYNKKVLKSGYSVIPGNEAITAFYQLISGKIQEGTGAVLTLNDGVIGIDRSLMLMAKGTPDGDLIQILSFASTKNYVKYMRGGNADRLVSWCIALHAKDLQAFLKQFEKVVLKYVPTANEKTEKDLSLEFATSLKEEDNNEIPDNK